MAPKNNEQVIQDQLAEIERLKSELKNLSVQVLTPVSEIHKDLWRGPGTHPPRPDTFKITDPVKMPTGDELTKLQIEAAAAEAMQTVAAAKV